MMARYILALAADAEERKHQERVRLRSIRDASDPFSLSKERFKTLFRLPNASAQHLYQLLKNYCQFNENDSIPKHLKILGALHFYADGGYQTLDGNDNLIGLSQPSMSRALDATTNAIINILTTQYIKFPTTPDEKQKTMREFQEISKMPNVLGAVDGSHISIYKPPNNDPMAPGVIFLNRKGFCSINCQTVTNARGRFISVNPNFPGSTSDSAVWHASALASHMEGQFLQGMEDQWLLGDKGYPQLPWLMIPVSRPETDAEINYNAAHTLARNTVEMSVRRLKNKFRCLQNDRPLYYEPMKAAKIIIACCTLYNMFWDALSDSEDDDDASDDEDHSDTDSDQEEEVEEEEDEKEEENQDYLTMGRAKREALIQLFR